MSESSLNNNNPQNNNGTNGTNGNNVINPLPSLTFRRGPCALGSLCNAKDQELSYQYRCRLCNRQLHGFISGCSQPKNPKDFRDGVICRNQPCVPDTLNAAQAAQNQAAKRAPRTDGAAIAAAAGLPKFLWETQQPKRKKDPNAPKQRRKRYTKEKKAEVLQRLRDTPGSKLPEIAKIYDIPEGTLRGWYDEERRKSTDMGVGVPEPNALDDIGDITAGMLDPPGLPADRSDPPPELPRNPTAELSVPVPVPVPVPAPLPPDMHHQDHMEETQHAADLHTDPNVEMPPQKKRRQRYSNETKIQVILALETRPNSSLNEVAREFNVAPGTVRGWREEADKIQKQAMENRRVGAKANPSRDPLRRVWDAILSLFEKNSRLPLQQRLEVNVAVVRTIGKQARDVLLEAHANKPFLTPTEASSIEKFKASETWARKWARDHQIISAKPETGSHAEQAQAKLTFLQTIIAEYPPECVYTMTPASLFYRILPHRTYVSKLGTQKRIRACKGLKSKDRLMLYLCTNETGTDKLPIACIGKYENPACFQVSAQKILPYISQKQALSDAGTFQRWWRMVFLPHVRKRSEEDGEKILLLVEDIGPCKAELLRDPTGQVRVEALPASQSNTLTYTVTRDAQGNAIPQQPALPQCQALEYGILETIKRRYRYSLLQEVMDAFDEREIRRRVADDADFPRASRGLREGNLSNVADAMRLLQTIWGEVAPSTISKSWQRTKLRLKPKEDTPQLLPGQRAKSEKRQTTRHKKQLIKDLNAFLKRHEAVDFSKHAGSNQLEGMVEKLKNCFLYTDGEVIEPKEILESLEEWIGLEESQGMVSLFMEEIKQEMNIEYLVGLKEPVEGVVPEADEPEDEQIEPSDSQQQGSGSKGSKEDELDLETARELATTIKATAGKLFQHGNILGELAVRLDDAADSVFRLLRKQQEQAEAKQRESDKWKSSGRRKSTQKSTSPTDDVDLGPMDGDVGALPGDEEFQDEAVNGAALPDVDTMQVEMGDVEGHEAI